MSQEPQFQGQPPPEEAQESASAAKPPNDAFPNDPLTGLRYVQYKVPKEETYLAPIRAMISKDLSEPYSIYVYRYFLNQWPQLCFMALDDSPPHTLRAVIVSKLEHHRSGTYRGYIAMLATASTHRRRGIASYLVRMAVDAMREKGADEVVLETETSNKASLKLYERLGFLRSKRLHRYYLNGNTAFRLLLYLKEGAGMRVPDGLEAQQGLLMDEDGENLEGAAERARDPKLAASEYDEAAYG